jgi:hypothetical protein
MGIGIEVGMGSLLVVGGGCAVCAGGVGGVTLVKGVWRLVAEVCCRNGSPCDSRPVELE